jgi:hypothetical protein
MEYDAAFDEWIGVRALEETLADGTKRYARVSSRMDPESFARLQALLPWARRRRLKGFVFFPEEGEMVPLSPASSRQFKLVVRDADVSADDLVEEWPNVVLWVRPAGGLPNREPYGFSPALRYFVSRLLDVSPSEWPDVANERTVEVIFANGEIRRLALPEDPIDALRKLARAYPSSAGVHVLDEQQAAPLRARDVAAVRIAPMYDWEREALESWRMGLG